LNKSESKYFHTAAKMDEAFLSLLGKKDFAYITVKEICEAAGVNRSTFYLHYETVGDLAESIGYINEHFLAYMQKDSAAFVARLRDCPLEELYLLTPEYLTPYLHYIQDHRRLFCTAMEHAAILRMEDIYDRLFLHVFTPILERYQVAEQDRTYMMAFYVRGLMAIITEWLKGDCADSIEHVITVMQQCVGQRREEA
jgi:AcrR family transcriptional regulator